jgi:hypothetical protein
VKKSRESNEDAQTPGHDEDDSVEERS